MNGASKRGAMVCALALGLGMMAGCQNQMSATPGCPCEPGAKHTLAMTGTTVQVVNDRCPIAGSHSVGKDRVQDVALVRDFRGKKVGFCCENCLPVWDKLSDERKQAALDAAMDKKVSG